MTVLETKKGSAQKTQRQVTVEQKFAEAVRSGNIVMFGEKDILTLGNTASLYNEVLNGKPSAPSERSGIYIQKNDEDALVFFKAFERKDADGKPAMGLHALTKKALIEKLEADGKLFNQALGALKERDDELVKFAAGLDDKVKELSNLEGGILKAIIGMNAVRDVKQENNMAATVERNPDLAVWFLDRRMLDAVVDYRNLDFALQTKPAVKFGMQQMFKNLKEAPAIQAKPEDVEQAKICRDFDKDSVTKAVKEDLKNAQDKMAAWKTFRKEEFNDFARNAAQNFEARKVILLAALNDTSLPAREREKLESQYNSWVQGEARVKNMKPGDLDAVIDRSTYSQMYHNDMFALERRRNPEKLKAHEDLVTQYEEASERAEKNLIAYLLGEDDCYAYKEITEDDLDAMDEDTGKRYFAAEGNGTVIDGNVYYLVWDILEKAGIEAGETVDKKAARQKMKSQKPEK